MNFYQELSAHYDEIFAAEPAAVRFLSDILTGRKSLLDIGCGTGNKTAHLAAPGRRIEAFDLDEGMIEQAKRFHSREGIHYRVLDMLALESAFAAGSFDAALCLGNTLPHLTGPKEPERFFTQLSSVLAGKGLFVLQIVNYDRVLRDGVTELPAIDTSEVKFIRRYRRLDGEMHFVTSLEIKATGETLENDIVLRPLRRDDVADALDRAGFEPAEYYGNYKGDPLRDDSFHLIAVSAKR